MDTKLVKIGDTELVATKQNDEIYVGIADTLTNIGLNENQKDSIIRKIKNDFVLSKCIKKLPVQYENQTRVVNCIEHSALPIMLVKIELNKEFLEENIHIGNNLIEYQLKAKDVLANAFLNKKEEFIIPKTFGEALKLAYEQQLIIEEQQLTIIEKDKEIESQGNVIIGLVREISLEEKRQILNEVIRKGGKNYSERWNLLYKHFSEKYHINLKIRRENWDAINKPKSKNMLDFIERGLGMLPELYDISCKLFHGDIDDIIEHYIQVRGV